MAKHRRDIAKDSIIKSMLPASEGLDIFESSAGRGELAIELQQAGHRVRVSNYKSGSLQFDILEDIVDLEVGLPYEDASFDVIICREVIEHIASNLPLLKEFARCLRPGGTLILTFPNKLSLPSRLYHLFTGFYNGLKSPINPGVFFGEAHVNLIAYHEMDYLLRASGLSQVRGRSSDIRPGAWLTAPLIPVVRLLTWYFLFQYKKKAQEHRKDKPEFVAYNREIYEAITSTELLLGKDVILSARKD